MTEDQRIIQAALTLYAERINHAIQVRLAHGHSITDPDMTRDIARRDRAIALAAEEWNL